MAIPSTMSDLSTTASSNSPSGSENVGPNMDNYIRAVQAIIKNDVSKGSDISSANALTIPDNGHYFVVTGTENITSIGNTYNGRTIVLKFSGILTIANSASLLLFGSDITTAAGDVLIFVNESTGVYRLVNKISSGGGEIFTDNVIISYGGSPGLTLLPTAGSGYPQVQLADSSGIIRGLVFIDEATGAMNIRRHDDVGSTVTLLTLDDDGNVFVNAAAPADPAHLTRQDYVDGELTTLSDSTDTALALKSPIASPTFTGVPAAPTAATTTDTTQVATTEFVQQELTASAAVTEITAFCNFDGELTGLNDPPTNNNIASVERTGAGVYDVLFDTAMDNDNYNIQLTSKRPSGHSSSAGFFNVYKGTSPSTSGFTLASADSAGTPIDIDWGYIIITGGLT